ncbi:MAG: hypothetical protein WCR63_00215 [Bacilli bacterium]
MSKFINLVRLISSNTRYYLNRKYTKVGKVKIVPPDLSVNKFMKLIQKENASVNYISPLTSLIIYDKLLLDQKLKSDFSDLTYALVSRELHINNHELTFKVMNHIGKIYVKNFQKSDAIFMPCTRQNRYIIKCLNRKMTFFFDEELDNIMQYFPVHLFDKKVLVISEYADLVKVQFVRLKADPKLREHYHYSLKAIDPKSIVASTDHSLYFESLDELRMKVLELAFDICIIREDIYSLALSSFITELKIPCIVLNDSLYSLFNIVKYKKQLSNLNTSEYISLEDYDSQEDEDFTATIYLSKKALIKKGTEDKSSKK